MANLSIKWKNENDPAYYLNANNLSEMHPGLNTLAQPFIYQKNSSTLSIASNTSIKIINNGVHKVYQSGDIDLDIDFGNSLDTGSIIAGKDYYVYLCDDGDTASIKISLASTYPSGYSAESSRKIGGFHTLCADVGTISGHSLSGYTSRSIIPNSVWCLNHRAECNNEGMVWSDKAKIWVEIYLSTTSSYSSVNGGTIKDGANWMDFVDDLGFIGKRLLNDTQFQLIAEGSNEKTNISGSSDPVTTGGHVDTAGRRMISNIGCEDCCGAMYQWLTDQSYRYDGDEWDWYDLPGDKGSIYKQGTCGDVKLLAGGVWASGSPCGSRCRSAAYCRWSTGTGIGSRGCARSRNS